MAAALQGCESSINPLWRGEYVDSPPYRVRGMAVPQLVWVNVKTGGSSPLIDQDFFSDEE